jgi:hypothetical protein
VGKEAPKQEFGHSGKGGLMLKKSIAILVVLLFCSTTASSSPVTDLRLFFDHKTDAKVYIDGAYLGVIEAGPDKPYIVPGLAEGKHTIEATPIYGDYDTETLSFSIKIGSINSLELTFQEREQYAYLLLRILVDFPSLHEYGALRYKSCYKCEEMIGQPMGDVKGVDIRFFVGAKPVSGHSGYLNFIITHRPPAPSGAGSRGLYLNGDRQSRINKTNYRKFGWVKEGVRGSGYYYLVETEKDVYVVGERKQIYPGEVSIQAVVGLSGPVLREGILRTVRAPKIIMKTPRETLRAAVGKTLIVTLDAGDTQELKLDWLLE